MTMNHDTDPTMQAPELQFSGNQIQYLYGYNDALRNIHFSYPEGDEGAIQQAIDSTVQSGVEGVMMAQDGQSDGVTLAVVSEGIGASKDQSRMMNLLDVLDTNPLLDPDDRNAVRDLAGTLSSYHYSGVSDQEVSSAFASTIGNHLGYISRQEQQGAKKDGLKIALLGLFAGVTVRQPQYQGAEQLMQEVERHRTPD